MRNPNHMVVDATGIVRLKIHGIPHEFLNHLDIYAAFAAIGVESHIVRIDLYHRTVVHVDFRQPLVSFWNSSRLVFRPKGQLPVYVRIDEPRRQPLRDEIISPVSRNVRFFKFYIVQSTRLHMGSLQAPTAMIAYATAVPRAFYGVRFTVNLDRQRVEVDFALQLSNLSNTHRLVLFKFEIAFADIANLTEMVLSDHPVRRRLLLTLKHPPRWYKKRDSLISTLSGTKEAVWHEHKAYDRQTHLSTNPSYSTMPINLDTLDPLIDFGRWLTFALDFDFQNQHLVENYNTAMRALRHWHVLTELPVANSPFCFVQPPDLKPLDQLDHCTLQDIYTESVKALDVNVRYHLEVCFSNGYLLQSTINRPFLDRLAGLRPLTACAILERVAAAKHVVYNPESIFDGPQCPPSILRRSVPLYCTFVRSCTITPTTIYFHMPTVDSSNRVLREHQSHADRFLRVRFTDEGTMTKLHSKDTTNDQLFERVRQVLTRGITLGHRHYQFLAAGNSQFREHGAYFYAPGDHQSLHEMREDMGDLSQIRTPSKWAARLGQNFSTTRAIKTRVVIKDNLEDIFHNGFCFTDGVGKISSFLAQMITSELGLVVEDPPSLYQFRLGGCKGVLAVDPKIPYGEVQLRPSQYKFPAKHMGLEVIRTSHFMTAHLNRQIILLLSDAGVPDKVFVSKMQVLLEHLAKCVVDPDAAIELLTTNIDFNQTTLTLANMILQGFMNVREPFMMSTLRLWRSWMLKYLKEKTKIPISKGAQLLGCVDEHRVLQGHWENLSSPDNTTATASPSPTQRADSPSSFVADAEDEANHSKLPQVFIQIDMGRCGKYEIIKGPVLLARNPSLHPGDVRRVLAVDRPELRHLRDVIVFPQNGDRDLPSMCSGGDLDGDDFLAIWDQDIFPANQDTNFPPMDFTGSQAQPLDRPVTEQDVIDFHVKFMQNDNLATIATAHMAQADRCGIQDTKCITLAALHSQAVDYPKSGVPVSVDAILKPKSWPHYMERRYGKSYHSGNILGQLYDMVETQKFVPDFDAPFDDRILLNKDFPVSTKLLDQARELKTEYDASMRSIMAHHGIKTEFEVWSSFVLEHNKEKKDYTFAEELGMLSHSLKDKYRKLAFALVASPDLDDLAPFVVAAYRVSHEEVQEYNRRRSIQDTSWNPVEPLLSFPWIFYREMGQIATGHVITDPRSKQGRRALRIRPRPVGQTELEGDIVHNDEVVPVGDLLVLFDDDDHIPPSRPTANSNGGPSAWSSRNLTLMDGPSLSNSSLTEPENAQHYFAPLLVDETTDGIHSSPQVRATDTKTAEVIDEPVAATLASSAVELTNDDIIEDAEKTQSGDESDESDEEAQDNDLTLISQVHNGLDQGANVEIPSDVEEPEPNSKTPLLIERTYSAAPPKDLACRSSSAYSSPMVLPTPATSVSSDCPATDQDVSSDTGSIDEVEERSESAQRTVSLLKRLRSMVAVDMPSVVEEEKKEQPTATSKWDTSRKRFFTDAEVIVEMQKKAKWETELEQAELIEVKPESNGIKNTKIDNKITVDVDDGSQNLLAMTEKDEIGKLLNVTNGCLHNSTASGKSDEHLIEVDILGSAFDNLSMIDSSTTPLGRVSSVGSHDLRIPGQWYDWQSTRTVENRNGDDAEKDVGVKA